ncbi:hypothetical protein [Paludibaculum fermentans]|uniref:hypothetical protein n=1 Tax=Paludibaculum fermentans TaxID=1473598 RepID=UPI003EC0B186
MTRRTSLILAALAALPLLAETKKNIRFTDYMNQQYGVQHQNGPGQYSFNAGGELPLVVTNTTRLVQSLRIRNLPNGEVLLLRHIREDQFLLLHEQSKQQAPLRLALQK